MPYKPFDPSEASSNPSILQRITTPIVDQLPSSVKEALDNFAHPGLNTSKAGAMLRGFLTGATEAVTPAHVLQAATLTPELGAAGSIPKALSLAGNLGMTAQGVGDVLDTKKTPLERGIGGVNAALSAVGAGNAAFKGAQAFQTAGKAAKAAEEVPEAVGDVSTVAGLHKRLSQVREGVIRNDPNFSGGSLTPEESLHVDNKILQERQFGDKGGPYEQAMKNHTDLMKIHQATREAGVGTTDIGVTATPEQIAVVNQKVTSRLPLTADEEAIWKAGQAADKRQSAHWSGVGKNETVNAKTEADLNKAAAIRAGRVEGEPSVSVSESAKDPVTGETVRQTTPLEEPEAEPSSTRVIKASGEVSPVSPKAPMAGKFNKLSPLGKAQVTTGQQEPGDLIRQMFGGEAPTAPEPVQQDLGIENPRLIKQSATEAAAEEPPAEGLARQYNNTLTAPKDTPINDAQRQLGQALQKTAPDADRLKVNLQDQITAQEAKVASAPNAGAKKAAGVKLDALKAKLVDIVAPRDLGSEKGGLDPMLAARMGLGTVGAFEGTKEDPLGKAYGESTPTTKALSTLGLGAAGFLIPGALSNLVGRTGQQFQTGLSNRERFMNALNSLHNSGLLSPLSVAKKGLGDIGGMASAGVENALSNAILQSKGLPTQDHGSILGSLVKNFPEILQAGREATTGPQREATSGLENVMQSGKNPLSWSGRAMSGLTAGTKKALEGAGYGPSEQKYYTMTSQPQTDLGAGVYDTWRRSKTAQFLAPFARMGVNRLERGFERSPFGLTKLFTAGNPQERAKIVARSMLGSGLIGGALAATPDDFLKKHPLEASLMSAAAGPYGVPLIGTMALKTAAKSPVAQAAKTITKDIPGLQSLEYMSRSPEEWARTGLAGFTNFLAPIAQLTNPGERQTQGENLNLAQRLFYRALANIPGIRGELPERPGSSDEGKLSNLFK